MFLAAVSVLSATMTIAKALSYAHEFYSGYTVDTKHNAASKHSTRPELQGPNDYQSATLPAPEIPKLAKKIAALARTNLYLTVRSEAQVIQVREWATRKMKEMHVREVDIVHILPYVVIWAFVETRWERAAREETLTVEYTERVRQTTTPLWTYEGPSWSHWFGRFIYEPIVVKK